MVRISTGKTSSQVYGTPKYLFNYFNGYYQFDIDVAASKENTLCKKFFDEEKNGLAQSWKGLRCWLNPPYNNVMPWAEKAIFQVQENNCKGVLLLLNDDPSTKWYKLLWDAPLGRIFYRIGHRIKFVGAKDSQSVSSVGIWLHHKYVPDRVVEIVNPERY